jgi:hypothetical protein
MAWLDSLQAGSVKVPHATHERPAFDAPREDPLWALPSILITRWVCGTLALYSKECP